MIRVNQVKLPVTESVKMLRLQCAKLLGIKPAEIATLEVLRRFCHAVAVQIYNLTVLLDVEKVAIGGGISKQPLLLESLRSAYDGLYASRAGQAYMEGLPRCQIVPCAFSSEANQVGVAAAYFEAMQKKC